MASSLGSLPACLPRSPTPEPPRGPSSSSAPLRVTVGKWRREGGVVAYEVSVAVGEEQWTVWKRFSDFRSLHSLCAPCLISPMPYQERVTRNIDLSNVAGVTEYEGNACCDMGCVADWVRLDIDREVDTGS